MCCQFANVADRAQYVGVAALSHGPTTMTTAIITISAGSSRRARRDQKAANPIPPRVAFRDEQRDVIR